MVVPVSQLYSYDTSEGGGVGNMKRREPLHWVGKTDRKAVTVQSSALVLPLFGCIKHSDLCRERWRAWALKTASCVRQVRLILWIRISAHTQSSRYRCCARNGADIITWSVEIPRARSGSEEENITEGRGMWKDKGNRSTTIFQFTAWQPEERQAIIFILRVQRW
jgi:hypothetical protein